MNLASLLNGTCRRVVHTGRYATRSVLRKENSAEHQWMVGFYCMVISHELEKSGFRIDLGLLMQRAIVHDIEESVTGDFLRKIKHANPEIHKALEEIGLQAVRDLDKELELDQSLITLWQLAKDDSVEGQILRLADVMVVVAYLVEERKMGNVTMGDIDHEVLEHLSRDVYPKLQMAVLKEMCAEVALYLCECNGINPHDDLKRKVSKSRERKNRNLRS